MSPLRSDMLWNDSINEGAGRRRGLVAAVDILKNDRGDVPFMWEDRSAVTFAELASFVHGAWKRDSRLSPIVAAAVFAKQARLGDSIYRSRGTILDAACSQAGLRCGDESCVWLRADLGGESRSKREDKVSSLGTHNRCEVENSSADGVSVATNASTRSGVDSQWPGLRLRLEQVLERVV